MFKTVPNKIKSFFILWSKGFPAPTDGMSQDEAMFYFYGKKGEF